MKILLTGAAGFIGSHLAEGLLGRGDSVVGLDSFNDYYDPARKRANIAPALKSPRFRLVEGDIRDRGLLEELFRREGFQTVIHLAARAGVRSSLRDPLLYEDVNVGGTLKLLEAARQYGTDRFLFASSSSVYGSNSRLPWKESDQVLLPVSPYGATKLAGEHFCRVFHQAYGLRVTIMRFFTVYGPRQRPDMAIHKFTRLIREGRPIPFFGDGTSLRDYTYIEDIVSGLLGGLAAEIPYGVFNLGGGHSISLAELVERLGELLGKSPVLERLPAQAGDVEVTQADVSAAAALLGYRPRTPVEEGLKKFVASYRISGEG